MSVMGLLASLGALIISIFAVSNGKNNHFNITLIIVVIGVFFINAALRVWEPLPMPINTKITMYGLFSLVVLTSMFFVNKLSKNIVDDFLNNMPKRFGYVIMNLNIHNTAQHPDFLIKEQITSHLDLISKYPVIYKAYSDNTKRNIKKAEKPEGDGKGGTYFGATGSGKSFTMLYLTRLLMKSEHFESPTIVLITDRIDLDDQLSGQFTNAKTFIDRKSVV